MTQAEKIRQELNALVNIGFELAGNIGKGTEEYAKFIAGYHNWYTRALAVIRHLLPDRLAEFERLYHLEKRKKLDVETYTIEDYVHGFSVSSFNSNSVAQSKFLTQVKILESAASRIDDILANIEGILQADLFDSEIDAARELKKSGHLRAAGAVVGVVLERHLANVCRNHGLKVPQKNPTIANFNDKLRDNNVYEIPTWRKIQHLGDIRNLCTHPKKKNPTPDEVQELIDGVDKVIKTVS